MAEADAPASSVITADLWPNICWTILMSAPLAMAKLAAVWRSSCGWKPGMPSSAAALVSTARWKV